MGFGQWEVGFEKGLAGIFRFVHSLRSPLPQPKENDARAVLVFCSYTLLVFRPDRAMTPACMDNTYQNGLMSERNASALALIFGGILHYHSLLAKK